MRYAIIGYGKMGREVEAVVKSRGGEVVKVFDIDCAEELSVESLRGVDVAIEFSSPEAALRNVELCLRAGVPVVCGTTGWRVSEAQELCKEVGGRMLWSSNFSIGVNLLFRINRQLSALMDRYSNYDVTISEVHHTEKRDAPSGTAITLAEGILDGVERKERWVLGSTCESGELGVASLRRSVVPGTHSVVWESEVDSIELKHTAKSRSGFAVGAVMAAEFLCTAKEGVYTIDDLFE